jgi:hypothetical protein
MGRTARQRRRIVGPRAAQRPCEADLTRVEAEFDVLAVTAPKTGVLPDIVLPHFLRVPTVEAGQHEGHRRRAPKNDATRWADGADITFGTGLRSRVAQGVQ